MKKTRVCILRTAGTNCDKETAFAFSKVDALPEFVHVNKLISRQDSLDNYDILAVSGGFSYGDDIAAGKILANELKYKLIDDIRKFIKAGKLIIGICNGFQILVKSGLLPGNDDLKQNTSLIINDSGKFEARWVYLKIQNEKVNPSTTLRVDGERSTSAVLGTSRTIKNQKCVWTRGLPEIIYLPVAHGEGKFVAQDDPLLEKLQQNGQVVFQYCDERGNLSGYPFNPNGSAQGIAGICDETGRIFGLMPHPERHIDVLQHPRWAGLKNKKEGDGLLIFRNAVEYAKKNL